MFFQHWKTWGFLWSNEKMLQKHIFLYDMIFFKLKILNQLTVVEILQLPNLKLRCCWKRCIAFEDDFAQLFLSSDTDLQLFSKDAFFTVSHRCRNWSFDGTTCDRLVRVRVQVCMWIFSFSPAGVHFYPPLFSPRTADSSTPAQGYSDLNGYHVGRELMRTRYYACHIVPYREFV